MVLSSMERLLSRSPPTLVAAARRTALSSLFPRLLSKLEIYGDDNGLLAYFRSAQSSVYIRIVMLFIESTQSTWTNHATNSMIL